MIESIHIKNFRGIQDGKIDRFSKINLLVGPNNSGKSAVLEAVYLESGADRPARLTSKGHNVSANSYLVGIPNKDILTDDIFTRVLKRHNRFSPIAPKQSRPLFDSTPKRGEVKIEVTPKIPLPNLGQLTLSIYDGLLEEDSTTSIVRVGYREIVDNFGKDKIIWTWVDNLFPGNFESSQVNPKKRIVLYWSDELSHYQSGKAAWVVTGTSAPSKFTFFQDVTTTLNHLPFEFFRQMLSTVPGWTQKIARSFRRVFEIQKSFNVNFLQLSNNASLAQGYIAPEDKIALTIDDYGDGGRSAFKLLTPLIALSELATESEPGVFLWEEPELFQNPRTLGKLLEEIALLIKDKPVQLFIATHSLDVIAQFTALAESGQIDEKDLMTFRLNLQEGQLTSSWFNVDNLKAWLAEGLDPRVWGEFKSPLQFTFQEDGE